MLGCSTPRPWRPGRDGGAGPGPAGHHLAGALLGVRALQKTAAATSPWLWPTTAWGWKTERATLMGQGQVHREQGGGWTTSTRPAGQFLAEPGLGEAEGPTSRSGTGAPHRTALDHLEEPLVPGEEEACPCRATDCPGREKTKTGLLGRRTRPAGAGEEEPEARRRGTEWPEEWNGPEPRRGSFRADLWREAAVDHAEQGNVGWRLHQEAQEGQLARSGQRAGAEHQGKRRKAPREAGVWVGSRMRPLQRGRGSSRDEVCVGPADPKEDTPASFLSPSSRAVLPREETDHCHPKEWQGSFPLHAAWPAGVRAEARAPS